MQGACMMALHAGASPCTQCMTHVACIRDALPLEKCSIAPFIDLLYIGPLVDDYWHRTRLVGHGEDRLRCQGKTRLRRGGSTVWP